MPPIDPAQPTEQHPRIEHLGAPVVLYESSAAVSRAVASEIADLIRAKAALGQTAVLGLATGSTPQGVYEELVRLHKHDGLSFRNVVTFNLDEYWPMQPDALQSYRRFMAEYLFDHVDIDPRNIHVPDGAVPHDQIAAACDRYDRQIRDAGGIDLQLLGIGRTGHIGFNEPGSPRDSRTRLITLDKITRMDAAADFFGEWNVPRKALTMGVGTILDARRIVLLAFGEAKAGVIRDAVQGPVSPSVAASFLQQHANAQFALDPAAAGELTPVKTPWLLGPIAQRGQSWDEPTTRRAVIWLAQQVNKPILKLVGEDYNEHGLQELLSARGSAYDVNIQVFKGLQNTITGWPGGKPGKREIRSTPNGAQSSALLADTMAEATVAHPRQSGDREGVEPEKTARSRARFRHNDGSPTDSTGGSEAADSSELFPKRVIIFSPHPDDDVISMGGTLIRLCQQGHDVHVAYQTSGNIAVFDDEAVRHADFVTEFCHAFELFSQSEAQRIEDAVQSFVAAKKPGEIDSPPLQRIKTMIRRVEARAAAQYSGVKPENIHFLEMPFYETGRVKKKPLSDADVRIIVDLLQRVRPQQIYAAGDLSDPHGTHRVCLAAVIAALERLSNPSSSAPTPDAARSVGPPYQGSVGPPWSRPVEPASSRSVGPPSPTEFACPLWLYRGAWQEWEPHRIEMAVPLSPDEVARKRMAIFKHQSQKDKALFPGPADSREFWQRAEDRNRQTAEAYDRLGLPEYEAIEAFVRWRAGFM